MEAIDGAPLSVRIAAGPLDPAEVLRLAAQLADALAHAHDRGIVHRDLKSGNVMVTNEGRAKVLDFGLAAWIGEQELAEVSTRAVEPANALVLGTVPYMAPEVLRGQSADLRSDIWSLGVVLHEVASGARPFRGVTSFELSSAILHDPPPPLPARVPEPLQAIIRRCLEKDPSRRYQRASEVRAAIEVAGPRGYTVAGDTPRLQGARGARRGLAAAAVVAIAVVAAMWWARVNPARRPITAIAVLPLANLSSDGDQDYFAAGLHEALITDLAHLGVQKVIAKPSADAFKDSKKPLKEIGRELGVDGVITGSVMRGGDRLLITAQLVRPETGEVVWANRYERSAADALAVQNEIVGAIAREVRGTISPEQQARLGAARQATPAAYDAYLRARFLFSNFSNSPDVRQLDAAYAQFERAIQIDPGYAPSHAAFSLALHAAPQIGMQSPATTLVRARALAQKAVELDGDLAEAHAALASILLWNDWDWAGTQRETQRALQLNPNSIDALTIGETYATLIASHAAEAAATSQRILSLDPINPFSRIQIGWVAFFSRRYDDADRAFTALLDLYPDHMFGHSFRSTVYGAQRRRDAVRAECAKVMQLLGPGYYNQAMGECVWALGVVGLADDARRLLARLEQPPPGVWMDPAVMANAYAGVGDLDRAFAWCRRGVDERAPNLLYMKVGTQWDAMRGDPRFQEVLRPLAFPP
jgi:serine/threonine-protein kinase